MYSFVYVEVWDELQAAEFPLDTHKEFEFWKLQIL